MYIYKCVSICIFICRLVWCAVASAIADPPCIVPVCTCEHVYIYIHICICISMYLYIYFYIDWYGALSQALLLIPRELCLCMYVNMYIYL